MRNSLVIKVQPQQKTSSNKPIDQLLHEASRCVKCGRCLSVCPVYKETRREPEAARGKLALIESAAEGEIQASSKKLKDIISFCLLCGSCAENCPNLVPGDTIIQKAREIFLSKERAALPYRLFLTHLLPFPERLDRVYKAGIRLSPLFLKNIPAESGLHLRFPIVRGQKHRLIPHLAHEPFLKHHPPMNVAAKPSLALFVGCVSNYLFPHLGEAALAILQYQGIAVRIPQEQACCGLMALGTGAKEVTLKLARRNIEAFESIGSTPIVAFCSSCSSHLKHYSELFEDEKWKVRAEGFSHRVKDFSEFLTDVGSRGGQKPTTCTQRLTFHDPCHLRRKQGIYDEPRSLLKRIEGVEFVETGQDNLCCGSGGGFNLSHYDTSLRIFQRRLEPIEKAAVDTVVTSCMGCLLQFMDGLHQEGKAIRVKHLVEILGEAFPR